MFKLESNHECNASVIKRQSAKEVSSVMEEVSK